MQASPVIPEGLTLVGWRNLSDGTFQKVNLNPGYGWTPVYVREKIHWKFLTPK